MKKLFALLLCMIVMPVFANIHVETEVLETVLQEHMPDLDSRVPAYREYNSQVRDANGAGIPASGIWYVCKAAGWDIENDAGKQQCVDFADTLLSRATWKFYAVCGSDKGITGGTERCVDNVFYHRYSISDANVTMLQADGLSKEYARIKYSDDIFCSGKARRRGLNDFVQCTSKEKPIYYEFKFDDVSESIDADITRSVQSAICEMYDTKYSDSGNNGGTAQTWDSWDAACKTTDAKLCGKINESMKRFGYATKIGKTGPKSNQQTACVISKNTIHSVSQLRTAFGIDNMAFSKGFQMSGYAEMRNKLCSYIKKNANTKITNCECNYNRTLLIQDGGKVDDVLTCYANDKPIDFVFDDLSESNDALASGGLDAFNCSVLGGQYQGKTCFTPDKELCDKIAAATLAECPECKTAYFDDTQNACVLPNATKATRLQKATNIGLIGGGIVAGGLIVFFTGGTGAVYVAVAVETAGGLAELFSQLHIDGVADEFFLKANNCNDASCAESILQEFFQYLSHMTNDLKEGELLGVDKQMERLIGLLPDDSQFLTDVVGACYEKNNVSNDNFDVATCDDGQWNPDQIVRAVGIALQFTSVFASVGKWMLGTGRVQKIAKQTQNMTKALQKKITSAKSVIAKKMAQGQSVKLSNGKNMATKAKTATKTPATATTTSAVAKTETASPKTFDIAEDGTISMVSGSRQVVEEVDEVTEYERLLSTIRNEDLSPEELAKAEARVKELEAKGVTLPENNAVGSAMQKIKAKTAGQSSNNDILRERMAMFAKNNAGASATTKESAKVDNVMQKATDIETNERAMVSKANVEDSEKRKEVVQGILDKSEEIAAANKIDRNTLSGVDKEWDELRRQYAPKNQTPEEFKASFQGDLEKAKTQTKHMRSWNDIESTEALKIERNQLVDNANVALSKSDYDEVSKMEDQIYEITEQIKDKDYFYQFARTRATKLQNQIDNFVLDPSVKGHTQADLDDLKRQLKEATEAMDVKDTSNYSTYDRNMTKMFKDAEKTKASIRDDLHTAQNKWQERTGGVGNFVESDEATSFFGKYGADVVEKAKGVNQWDIAEKFRLKNVDNVSQERVVAYNAVLDENPSLEAKLHRKEWSRLTESEKRDVLQAVADKYAEKLGTPRAKIVVEQKGNNGVLGSQLGDRITFNLEYIDSGIDKLSDTLVHEYSHLIDELSPNAGALGSQYAHYAGKIYSNKAEEGYRVALTEQSSYKIGKAVADAVAPRKMANPFSDGISYLYKFDGVFDAKGGVTSADLSGLMNGEQGFVYLSDIDAIADNVDEIYGTLKNQGMTIRSFTQNGTDFYMIGTKGYFDKLLN